MKSCSARWANTFSGPLSTIARRFARRFGRPTQAMKKAASLPSVRLVDAGPGGRAAWVGSSATGISPRTTISPWPGGGCGGASADCCAAAETDARATRAAAASRSARTQDLLHRLAPGQLVDHFVEDANEAHGRFLDL